MAILNKLDRDSVEDTLKKLRESTARGIDDVLVELLNEMIGGSYTRGTVPQPTPKEIVSAASNAKKNTALQDLLKAISQLQKPDLKPELAALIKDVLSKLQQLVQK
jgi:hypothetical protein